MTTKATLKEIFVKHGLDPFDVFLSDPSEWPQEAQDLLKANPAPEPPAEIIQPQYAEDEWEN